MRTQMQILFQRNLKEFQYHLVTNDETCIHCYTPKAKELSKEWTLLGEDCLDGAELQKKRAY